MVEDILLIEGIQSNELIAKWFAVSKFDDRMRFGVKGEYRKK